MTPFGRMGMWLMNTARTFWVGIRTAFAEMKQHKLRSFLSILGVMLGVAALVAMLSLIGGIEQFLEIKMGRWSGAMFIRRTRHPPEDEKISWSRSPGMRLTDALYLDDTSSNVSEVYHRIDRRGTATIAGERFRRMRVRGLSFEAYAADSNIVAVGRGRMFTDREFDEGRKVCMVSWGILEHLGREWRTEDKDTADIVGMTVSYNQVNFEIVGTIAAKDPDFKPWHWGWTILVPLRSMQKYIAGFNPDPGYINLTVTDPEEFEEQAEAVMREMEQLHRGVRDVEFRGPDWADNIKTTMGNISMVMGIISVVSLLVGGLGIMNVMLSSISERIKEIGVRKALGARNSQIFVQFLAETTTLSFVGGIFGAAIGLAPLFFGDAIKKSTQGVIMPTVLPEHVVFVFLTIVGVGVLFGLYPAVKASRMDPVDALRYE